MQVINKRGSATIEAAIVLPMFITVILLFSSFLICIIASNCMYSSLYKSAEFFSDYAYIYHENGIKKIENNIISDLSRLSGDGEAGAILKLINVHELSEGVDNLVYGAVCEKVFMHYLKKDPVYKSGFIKFTSVSFMGSSFFDSGDDIVLIARGRLKFPLPVPVKLIEGFEIRAKIKFRCWVKGDVPVYEAAPDNLSNVWSLDNFERGLKIREVFGANLPVNFPVIAKYDNGSAVMIKSLDHTAKTYKNEFAFSKIINDMINELSEFKGSKYGDIIVLPEDIRVRELILVLPTNELTAVQQYTLSQIRLYARIRNVVFTVERYQEKK